MAKYRYRTWSDIPFRIKLEFFSFWSLTSLLANVFLVISTIYNLASLHSDASTTIFLLHTFANAVVCASLVRYLEYNSKFYTLIMTLKLAFARVVRCVISIVPLFFGYVIAGVVLFSPYSYIVRTLCNRFV